MACADGRDAYLVPSGEPPLSAPRLLGRAGDEIINGRFLFGGDRLAMLDASETISFWALDSENAAPLRTVLGPRQISNNWDFDSSGRWMETANGVDQSAFVWDLGAPITREPLTLRRGDVDATHGLAIHPKGRWAAVADRLTASLWPLSSRFPRILWRQDTPMITVAFDPRGHWLCSGSNDGKLRLWSVADAGDGLPVTLYENPQRLMSLAVSPDGLEVAAGRWDGVVVIVPTGGGPVDAFSGEVPIPQVGGWLSSDGRKFFGMRFELEEGDGSDLRVYDLESSDSWALPSHGDQIEAAGWHPSGEAVVSSSRHGAINVGTFRPERTHLLFGENASWSVAVDPNERWIAAAGSDGILRLWPIPDVSEPPLRTLPRRELLAKLKSLTNLRAVHVESSPTGYRLELDDFPGWSD